MKICAIGRSEILYDTIVHLQKNGHEVAGIVTSKEAPEYKKSANEFLELANQIGAKFLRTTNLDGQINFFQNLNAEIAVSFNNISIISDQVIKTFPLGILNAHGGDLPRYRGNACQAWAIINGESSIGLCIHKMVGGQLDSGDIIVRDYLDINDKTVILETWNWLNEKVPSMFDEAILKIKEDPAYFLEKQVDRIDEVLRCYPRKPEDAKINWNSDSLDIIRLVNASGAPYAGAFCEFGGKILRILKAAKVDLQGCICAIPGQLIEINEKYFDVACGNGCIRITSFRLGDEESDNPVKIFKSLRNRLE